MTRVGCAEISIAAKCFVSSNKAFSGAGDCVSSGDTAYRSYFLVGACSSLPHLSTRSVVFMQLHHGNDLGMKQQSPYFSLLA